MAFVVGMGFGSLRMGWRRLSCGRESLRLERVLQRGIAFRWREIEMGREWAGVVGQRLIVLRQEEGVDSSVDFWLDEDRKPGAAMYDAEMEFVNAEKELREYFNLSVETGPMIEEFMNRDENFASVAHQLKGTRVLRLDPVECLFSFLCSSNNNIKRIMSMVNHLALRYGVHVGDYGGYSFHTFPTIEQLCAEATEEELRANGFGYRARYVVETAKALVERGGEEWLFDLRSRDRQHVSEQLVQLSGIGKKVASCVALFSLDKHDEVPIDTHIWKMTVSKYIPKLKGKSLTEKVYDSVGDFYRERFGENVGWAHTVLFGAQLDAFRSQGKREEGKEEPLTLAKEEWKAEETMDVVPTLKKRQSRRRRSKAPPACEEDPQVCKREPGFRVKSEWKLESQLEEIVSPDQKEADTTEGDDSVHETATTVNISPILSCSTEADLDAAAAADIHQYSPDPLTRHFRRRKLRKLATGEGDLKKEDHGQGQSRPSTRTQT